MSKIKAPNVKQIYSKIKEILESQENLQILNDVVKEFDSNASFRGVIVGSYKVIASIPCAVVIPGATTITPVGSGYTFEFRFDFDIVVYTKNIMHDEAYFYHWKLTQTIWEILASPDYERWVLNDGVIYLFSISKGIDQQVVEGGALRASTIHATALCRKTLLRV
jgi:hypothetical protein